MQKPMNAQLSTTLGLGLLVISTVGTPGLEPSSKYFEIEFVNLWWNRLVGFRLKPKFGSVSGDCCSVISSRATLWLISCHMLLIPEPVAAEWTSMRRVSMSCGMGRIWHFVESSTVCSTGRFSLNRGTNRRGNTNPGLFQSCIIVHLVGFLRPECSGLPYWMYLHLEQFISKAFSGIRLGGTPVPIFA